MRRFHSYGSIDTEEHYYAPRKELIEKAIDQAAEYGKQMGLREIFLLVFVELSEEEAKQLEKEIDKHGVKVIVLSVGIL